MQFARETILTLVPIVIYLLIVFVVIWVQRWRRKSRWPFKSEDKLLRGPGEDLRKQLIEIDERFMFEFFGGIFAGATVLVIFTIVGPKYLAWSPAQSLTFGMVAALGMFALSAWRIARLWQKRQNYYLGWYGERYVAEWLEPAKVQGWRIFHDVPFSNNGAKFNIDHVAVGPGGVFVIETKTRRKGKPRPGFKDNEVFFDGRNLVWPWGEDNHGLEQAERNAQWMMNWIRNEIGERVHVSPILALPGWWVDKKPAQESRVCAVVNPKWLPGMLGRERTVLEQRQIDLIALRIEAKCRDVEE